MGAAYIGLGGLLHAGAAYGQMSPFFLPPCLIPLLLCHSIAALVLEYKGIHRLETVG